MPLEPKWRLSCHRGTILVSTLARLVVKKKWPLCSLIQLRQFGRSLLHQPKTSFWIRKMVKCRSLTSNPTRITNLCRLGTVAKMSTSGSSHRSRTYMSTNLAALMRIKLKNSSQSDISRLGTQMLSQTKSLTVCVQPGPSLVGIELKLKRSRINSRFSRKMKIPK